MTHLRKRVRKIAGHGHWHVNRWLVFAADGSRFNCPRSQAKEEKPGCAGRAKTGPQLLLTSLFHVGTGLLWDFCRGTGQASERSHLLSMLNTLPREALLRLD